MKSNGFYDDMSIDDILNDIKEMNNEKEPTGRIWSMEEIDALLAEETDADLSESFAEEKVEIASEDFENEESHQNDSFNLAENVVEDEQELEESVEETYDEVSPLLDSVTELSQEEPQAVEENKAEQEITGQLTIEKTRIFNEVETRAIRNESIEHNIGKSKIIKTGEIPKGGMEKDPYRERFLNKPELNIEKTLDHIEAVKNSPLKTIEKHGVVVKKTEKTGKDGLSPVPILVDAVDEFEAQQRLETDIQSGVLNSNEIGKDKLDNQIVLDGFDDSDEVNIVSEAEEEAKLRKIRKDRASKFKLFPNLDYNINEDAIVPETEEKLDNEVSEATKIIDISQQNEDDEAQSEEASQVEAPVEEKDEPERESVRVARDFYGPKDARAVYDIFKKELSQAKFKLISSVAALLVLLVCSIITSMFSNFSLFADSPYVYSALNLIVLCVIGAINIKSFTQAVDKLKKKKFDSNSALAIAIILGALQCIVSFAYGELVLSGMHIYAAVALFPVMLINLGEYIKLSNDMENFVLLNNEQGSFYAIKSIDDDDVAFEVGRGLMIKDPDIRYRAKVDFPYKFVEMSRLSEPTKEMFNLVIPVAVAAAVIVGFISSIIYRNIFVGVSALAGVYLMAVPAGAFVSLYLGLREANRQLNQQKGMISGYEAVENALNTNAVIVDSVDMFNNENTNIYGIKLFNSMRIDEAIIYTAAVVIQSDGALTDVFDSIILENRDILPNVESLAYEEKLGCSGWIYNYRVLVGNRDLLIKHNVDVQSKEEERKYTSGGKQVLYLAVEGKVAAMFVVGYGADEKVAHYFRMLEKAGVNILVKTSDANITEALVEQYFGLPHNFIKIISPVAGVMYKQYSEKAVEKEPCRILSEGNTKSGLRAFLAAFMLNEQKNISTILQYVGVGIGILLMAMFAFVAGLTQAGALQMILFEALWTLVVVFVPQLIKKI